MRSCLWLTDDRIVFSSWCTRFLGRVQGEGREAFTKAIRCVLCKYTVDAGPIPWPPSALCFSGLGRIGIERRVSECIFQAGNNRLVAPRRRYEPTPATTLRSRHNAHSCPVLCLCYGIVGLARAADSLTFSLTVLGSLLNAL